MSWRKTVEENGFAIIPNVVAQQETDSVLDVIAHTAVRRSRAGIRHVLGDADVAKLAGNSQVLAIARDVLGNSAFPFRATMFEKSPKANWLVVWHQDTALPMKQRTEATGWGPWSVKEAVIYAHAPASALSRILALRIHLDDSTEENGPLRVLPGTHTLGVLTDDQIHQLATDVSPIDCVVSRGGVLAMRPLLVHSSPKLEVETPRRVLHIEYTDRVVISEGLELAVG